MLRTFSIKLPNTNDWYELPCQSISFSTEAGVADDSTFQSFFQSGQTTLIGWSISTELVVKSPAYRAKIMKTSGSIPVIDFPLEQKYISDLESLVLNFITQTYEVDGDWKIYYFNDATKQVIDYKNDVVLKDDGVVISDADIDWIDYLHGIVKLSFDYEVQGEITISATTYSLSPLCYANEISLTHTTDLEDVTTFCDAQSNNGYRIFKHNRQSVGVDMSGFYDNIDVDDLKDTLRDREVYIIEFNPDGQNENNARGYFQTTQMQYAGDDIETLSTSHSLHVPTIDNEQALKKPFSWDIRQPSKWNGGVKSIIASQANQSPIDVKYEFSNGRMIEGRALVGEGSFNNAIDDVTRISLQMQGVGDMTII